MKEWLLYCILCSVIYALSAQAQPHRQEMTANVIYWNQAKLPVLDCTVALPNIDSAIGRGATLNLGRALQAKGYTPLLSRGLQIQGLSQADSAGHQVIEYYTDRNFKQLNRNGQNSLYLSLTGIRSVMMRTEKKHKFTLRLHTIGRAKEIAKSIQIGTLGESSLNVQDLPNCQPQDLE